MSHTTRRFAPTRSPPPPLQGYLHSFMSYSKSVLSTRASSFKSSAPTSHLTDNTFQTMGVIHTLALLFKTGDRAKFLAYVDYFMEEVILIAENTTSQTMMRKLLVKLFQRVGTTFMPVRIVPWRYQRGKRR